MTEQPSYSYQDLADRIEHVLGERPSLSTLRAAAADNRRRAAPRPWPRITVGMPAPESPRSCPAKFSQAKVEAWLKTHPRHQWVAACQRLVEATGPDRAPVSAIAQAHRQGLSWRQIAAILTKSTGHHHSAGSIYFAAQEDH